MDASAPPAAGGPGGDGPAGSSRETPRRFSREQLFVLISAASMNLGSLMAYSILGPFFPKEAENKGASNTMIGVIFGCYALFEFLASLVFGKYHPCILVPGDAVGANPHGNRRIIMIEEGAYLVLSSRESITSAYKALNCHYESNCNQKSVMDQLPDGPIFIAMCFLMRVIDAIGFGAAITASSSILTKAFPNNVATVLGSLEVFTGLGLVVGPLLGSFLYQSFGYEVPFISLGYAVLMMPLNICILPSYGHSFSSVALRHFGNEKERKPTQNEPGIIMSPA